MERLVGFPYIEPFGCFTLVRKALEIEGKFIPEYTQELYKGATEAEQAAYILDKITQHAVELTEELGERPRRGDIVLLRIAGQPSHIGILVSPTEVLHCIEGVNACIESLTSIRWRGRVVSYWRI